MSQYIEMNIPDPIKQAIVTIAAAVVTMLGGAVVSSNPQFAWMTSCAFLLLFLVANSAMAIFSDDFMKYVQKSLPIFVGTLIIVGVAAFLVSGISIFDTKAYRTIYIVLILAYFSLLTLCFLIRRAADFLRDKETKG